MIVAGLTIGIILSLIYIEWVRITPGGIIVPGYLALYMNQTNRILFTLVIAAAVYGVLLILKKYMFVYGRRRYGLALILGILFQCVSALFGLGTGFGALAAIGYLIPGIIANHTYIQGPVHTFLGLAFVTLSTYGILYIWL